MLDLYLTGAESVTLAASYAQRNTKHAAVLWDTLIQHCLDARLGDDGTLFGSLLEAAALCGADLALLVTRIPEGMNVHGLRPKLVKAVGDYRLKLKMHEASKETGETEKIGLLRELGHRSRRGTRFHPLTSPKPTSTTADEPKEPDKAVPTPSSGSRRPIQRPARYRSNMGLPVR
mmetsp:Transcript_26384/g.61383  ORF Transcript_26384/g.61383 Transcript_26384/m.61383 type:complete len:175 (-) Transcript_26384:1522-2046(-)